MRTGPGPAVRAALARAGIRIRRATPLYGHGHTSTSRLTLVDGGVAKLRVFPSVADASRVERCLAAAPPGALPALLARSGRSLATEYVDGVRLDRHWRTAPAGTRSRHIAACARALARVHGGTAPALPPTPLPVYSRAIAQATRRLARAGLLDRRQADWLRALPLPVSPAAGLAHGDPSPDNLVVTPAGRLRFIDEERVAVRPLAYDLARAICQWRLDGREERRFLAAYARAGGSWAAFAEHRAFWMAAALSTSVVFRWRRRPGTVARFAAALRGLVSEASPTRPRRR